MFIEKPFAPKPVKRYSRTSGLKLKTGFDKGFDVDSQLSLSVRGKSRINLENPYSPEIIPKKSIKNFMEEEEFCLFKRELEYSKSEEFAKCEIFSILNRTESTLYASTGGKTESSQGDVNRLPSNPENEENLRLTLPPVRIKNPFHKTIYCDSSGEEKEVDLNVINFKSIMFCRGKTIEN